MLIDRCNSLSYKAYLNVFDQRNQELNQCCENSHGIKAYTYKPKYHVFIFPFPVKAKTRAQPIILPPMFLLDPYQIKLLSIHNHGIYYDIALNEKPVEEIMDEKKKYKLSLSNLDDQQWASNFMAPWN